MERSKNKTGCHSMDVYDVAEDYPDHCKEDLPVMIVKEAAVTTLRSMVGVADARAGGDN